MPTKNKSTKSKSSKKVLGRETKDLTLVRSAVNPDVRFFLASEMADDLAIEQSVLGKMVESCVYEFPQDGKPVRGLTVQGVKEAARIINTNPKSGMRIGMTDRLWIKHDTEINGQKGVQVEVQAVDHVSGMSNWGVKFEPYKKFSKKTRQYYDDTFVVEKAVSKAQRNAIAGLIPLQLKTRIIQKFAEQGKVVQLAPPPAVTTVVKSVEKTKPQDLTAIIKHSIETTDDPSLLLSLAEKCEQSPKLEKASKIMLSTMAKTKANRMLDEQAERESR